MVNIKKWKMFAQEIMLTAFWDKFGWFFDPDTVTNVRQLFSLYASKHLLFKLETFYWSNFMHMSLFLEQFFTPVEG